MGILVANDGSRFVDTLADRNAIANRFKGMRVTVKDATADPVFGGGAVQYQWDATTTSWLPIWAERKPELFFSTEEKTIVAGKVTADNIPHSDQVWSARIVDTDGVIMGDAQVVVVGRDLVLNTEDYNGKTLHYTYAYGDMTVEMGSVWEGKADKTYVDQQVATRATEAYVNQQIAAIEMPEGGISEAPQDGKRYVRLNAGWTEQTVGISEAPQDGKNYVRSNAGWAELVAGLTDAPNDGNRYLRQGAAWVEQTIVEAPTADPAKLFLRKGDKTWVEYTTGFDVYSLKSSTSASGTLTVNYVTQQTYAVTNTGAGGRTIGFSNGPAGRMVTAVLVIVGATGELTWTGTNIKWADNTAVNKAALGATKTVITFLWDGVDTWIGSKGAAY